MMKVSFYQPVKVITGNNSIASLGELLLEQKYSRPFVVFDKGIRAAGIADRALSSISDVGIDYIEYDKVMPDPEDTMVDEAAELCRKEKCDCVIGIGGGAPMDTAKAVNILRINEGKVSDYFGVPAIGDCPGLILIPTTAGTGAELSSSIVITDTINNRKSGMRSEKIAAEYAIIDPSLTLGLPRGITVSSALDAFSHAAEAYVNKKGDPFADMICEKIMETIVEELPKVTEDPGYLQGRNCLLCAASMSGLTLRNNAVNAGHAIGHSLGAVYHIPHGTACAYGFPIVFRRLAEIVPEKTAVIASILGAELSGDETPEEIGISLESAYRSFCKKVGLPSAKEYGVSMDGLDALAALIAKDGTRKNNLFEVDEAMAYELAKEVLQTE